MPRLAYADVDDRHVCLYNANLIEKQKGIKTNILSTISLVETGRFEKNGGFGFAWPWTISYQGKGEYFDSKEEAVAKVKELRKKGINSIDVGCMQINLYYHSGAFVTLEEAFDPHQNMSYAADFVKRLYEKHGTWGAAATAYHSHDYQKAYKYENKLIQVWNRMKEHLASGGKLYEIKEEPMVLTASVKLPLQPARAKKKNAGLTGDFTAKPNNLYNGNQGADFAASWRTHKLAQYNARKENKVYRSNMFNIKQEGSRNND